MATIVILDTGVADYARKDNCIMTLTVEKNVNCYIMNNGGEDIDGHGTMIYNLYSSILPEEKYIMIQILKKEKIDEDSMIFALKYIYDYIECDIISISGGIRCCTRKKELENICNELSKKEIFIVAAFDNIGGLTYPAAFDSVIGVDYVPTIKSISEYIWVIGSPINYLGHCGNNVLKNHNNEVINIRGNSFIVPFVVMQIVELLKRGIVFEQVREELKKNATQRMTFKKNTKEEKKFKIKKAIVFPYNKETITMIKYACWLKFELHGVYDYKYSGNVSREERDVEGNKYIVEDESLIDWNSDFDTLILGHCGISNEVLEKIYENIVKNAKLNFKNIFSLDGRFLDCINLESQVYYPRIEKKDIPKNYFGKLYLSTVPIIGVFGTGSKQGKFGTQLYLRNEFEKRKYKVGQIGTEPISELFGFDEVFPVGYNSHNEATGKEAIAVLNEMVKRIEEKEVDLIIFGSQSYTLSYEYSQLDYFVDYQDFFLKALRPDIAVICVGIEDEIEYVKRTIDYIKALGESIVVGLIISPIKVKNSWREEHGKVEIVTGQDMQKIKNRLTCLELPVFTLKDFSSMEKLVESCIEMLKK